MLYYVGKCEWYAKQTKTFSDVFFATAGLAMRGVAIYFSRSIAWEFVQVRRDPQGRWLWVMVKLNRNILNFVNYYGPIMDKVLALAKMNELLRGVSGQIIFGGDFNYIQDLKKDISNKNKKQLKSKTKKIFDAILSVDRSMA